MVIEVNTGKPYSILLERGALARAGQILNLQRQVLIVTDSGVPAAYAQTVAAQCLHPVKVCVPKGEGSKSLPFFERLCRIMSDHHFTRTDCVVAVGGGVVGDLAGFCASSYMRGIDFYNIPTTVLSQVDSSIGGKTAVNLGGIKNIVGAFYQPRCVLIDPDTLDSLPPRQIANGLAESVKMALTSDPVLFDLLENEDITTNRLTIIERSLRIKKAVVEQDETEQGLRKVLNFGHTIGHAIESEEGLGGLYHGECVALGMLPFCSDSVRPRLTAVLKKLSLPVSWQGDREQLWQAAQHDKKFAGDTVTVVSVPDIGHFTMETLSKEQLKQRMMGAF